MNDELKKMVQKKQSSTIVMKKLEDLTALDGDILNSCRNQSPFYHPSPCLSPIRSRSSSQQQFVESDEERSPCDYQIVQHLPQLMLNACQNSIRSVQVSDFIDSDIVKQQNVLILDIQNNIAVMDTQQVIMIWMDKTIATEENQAYWQQLNDTYSSYIDLV